MKKTKDKTIEELTKSGYYYVNSNINSKNFPVPERIETEGYKMISLEGYKTSEECLEIIRQAGCRPANIYELAELRESHPEEFTRGKYHIAFGSEWTDADGNRRVPYVFANVDGDFRFFLGVFGSDWDADVVLVCFCDIPSEPLALKSDSAETLSPLNELNLNESIGEAIELLKANGFRIYKTEEVTTEY